MDESSKISSILPWTEKYRPTVFSDVVSHDNIVNTLKIFIKNRSIPHMLFYGPPGTGKTTIINICAREMYGPYYQFMVMELNASDDRGIDVVRTKVRQFVASSNVFFTDASLSNAKDKTKVLKLVVLDEIDAMTQEAQAILKKIMEKYSYNTRFCLICNYIQNINESLQSRCCTFRFSPIPYKFLKLKIDDIILKEDILMSPEAKDIIVKRSNGDMRNILNMLQSVGMIYEGSLYTINENDINKCLGFPTSEDISKIFDSLKYKDFLGSYTTIKRIKGDNGLALEDIMTDIHDELIKYLMTDETNYELLRGLETRMILDILKNLRVVECNVTKSGNENVQMSALISLFKIHESYV